MRDNKKTPKIYAYRLTDPRVDNLIKIGYTTEDDVEIRIKNQFGSRGNISPLPYEILYYEEAITNKGIEFMDHSVHTELENKGVKRVKSLNDSLSEFFITDLKTVIDAIRAVKEMRDIEYKRKQEPLMFPTALLNKPLTIDDKNAICERLNILDDSGRLRKWETVSKLFIDNGYKIENKTIVINGRRRRVSIVTM